MKRTHLWFSFGALLLLLTPIGSRADDTADEADLQFEMGIKSYTSKDYIGALEHFLASNRLAPNRTVMRNIGRAYEKLDKFPEAFRYYVAAQDGETNPTVRDDLQKSIAGLSPKVAVIDVKTDPAGATIYLDRRDLGPRGTAPRLLGLPSGKYKILVELPGYENASADVEVKVGTQTPLLLKLVPILGKIRIEGEGVAGAVVRLDKDESKPICTAPCTVDLIPGKHVLLFTREGFQPTEVPIDVLPKSEAVLRPKMNVITGGVVVNADVRDALVEIDGKPFGFTPAVLQVPVGRHKMRVSLSGFRAVDREIVVTSTEQTKVEVALSEVTEVIAASRVAESVEDAPSSVSVIPSSELRGMGYPTIAEALRGVRGVYLSDDRSYSTLGFRGFSRVGDYGNRVLVLVDGQPTNDNYIGSSYVGFDGRTDLDDVERIEVVRGPGSALYGTGAFFGVVNLVTRSRTSPSHVEASLSAVDYGVARARVTGHYNFSPDAGIWTSFSGARGTGRDFTFSEFAVPGSTDGTARSVDGFDAGTISGRVWWKALTLQWMFNGRKKTLPTAQAETLFADPRSTFRDYRGFLEARFEPKISDVLQSLTRVHVNSYDFRGTLAYSEADGGVNTDRFRGQWAGFEQRFVVSPAKALRITAGGEIQSHFKAEQSGVNDVAYVLPTRNDTFLVGAGYLLADIIPVDKVKIVLGGRFDYYRYNNAISSEKTSLSSINPRLAIVTHPWTDGTVKLLGGKAFRAPSVYELFYTALTQKPPTNLKPEEIYSGELELSQRLSPTLSMTGSAFTNYVNRLVILRTEPGGLEQYQNSDKPVFTVGGEFEVRRDFRQGYMFAAQVSVQKTRYLKNEDLKLRDVPNSPILMASIKGAFPIIPRVLSAQSRLSFVGARYDRNDENLPGVAPQGTIDPAFVWDLVFTGEAEKGIRYGFGVYNLFDYRYSAPVSSEFKQTSILQNGRTFFLSLTTAMPI